MPDRDVTKLVDFGRNDDEFLPLTKCVCGHRWNTWDFSIALGPRNPYYCPYCGRFLYFTLDIHVFEVDDNASS